MEYSTLEELLVKLVCSVEFPINQSNTETGDQLSSETGDQLSSETGDQSSVGSIKISGLDHKLGKFISRQMVPSKQCLISILIFIIILISVFWFHKNICNEIFDFVTTRNLKVAAIYKKKKFTLYYFKRGAIYFPFYYTWLSGNFTPLSH